MSMVTYLVLGCALYVYLDATKNKIGKVPEVKRFTNMSAGMWATGTAMLWDCCFSTVFAQQGKAYRYRGRKASGCALIQAIHNHWPTCSRMHTPSMD